MKQRNSFIVLDTELAGDGTSKYYYSADTPDEVRKHYGDILNDLACENYESYAHLFQCECPTELLIEAEDTQDDDEYINEEELECTGDCGSDRYGYWIVEYDPRIHDLYEPDEFDSL